MVQTQTREMHWENGHFSSQDAMGLHVEYMEYHGSIHDKDMSHQTLD